MEYISLGVVRDRRYRSADGFDVYGNRGAGPIDWTHPVNTRLILLWEDAPVMPGHLEAGHGAGHHLDSVKSDGHFSGTHVLDAQCCPAGMRLFRDGPFVVGRFRHVVVVQDRFGNAGYHGLTVHETVVNSEPAPPDEFQAAAFDGASGRMTFSFCPSEQLR